MWKSSRKGEYLCKPMYHIETPEKQGLLDELYDKRCAWK